jgi:hypothetical protein
MAGLYDSHLHFCCFIYLSSMYLHLCVHMQQAIEVADGHLHQD